ncbi:MFS transporter [Leekyejoonella antrihumi]|uniref:MFS transporter n=1 Tax=Leekyejoonella antrihumi TaxID=1660198 RepID=A0A563DXU7_9MICO|nr:MFS transporter [Leekyejoonella antrihumi]TWP34949.1 MFS transporter [Leekyejoonella antrihumi]
MSSATETTPVASTIPKRRLYAIIGALLLGMLLAALDQTIVATALPTIVGDLGGANHLSWIVTAYLLAVTASTPLWGKLGDMYGRKQFFQAAIVIFLIGSILSGLSQSMLELILFRALQGLGGGGLMIGAQAIIGDVVSPRERGKYQGLFGAVFGVTSVVGPLLGGLLVDGPGWRWVFYINVPVGAIALVVTAIVLPGTLSKVRHTIDYLGTILIAATATDLVLLTSLGGTTYAWNSFPIYFMAVLGVVLLAGFILAERRAAEPVLPLNLFTNKVFAAASAIGFVVGFAMFGAITYLPLFLQVVQGVNPTISGVRMLPMMAGLLMTSIGSGILISKWGRYKVFPVMGTAIMTLGMFLLSHMGVGTSIFMTSVFMFVLGVGLGCVMQVLVIVVQSAVDYKDLGVATAGATFFRSIGGSFGTAVFGAIFAGVITGHLRDALGNVKLPGGAGGSGISPEILAKLPAHIKSGVIDAYAGSLQTVFLVAVPIGIVAFLLTWILPEIELRATTGAVDAGETFAMPVERSSLEEVERAITVLDSRENRHDLYADLARRADLDLGPRECWLLYRFDDHPESTLAEISAVVNRPVDRLTQLAENLHTKGLLVEDHDRPGHRLALSTSGHGAIARLLQARRDRLEELLGDWSPEDNPDLVERVRRLAGALMADDDKMLEAARTRPPEPAST